MKGVKLRGLGSAAPRWRGIRRRAWCAGAPSYAIQELWAPRACEASFSRTSCPRRRRTSGCSAPESRAIRCRAAQCEGRAGRVLPGLGSLCTSRATPFTGPGAQRWWASASGGAWLRGARQKASREHVVGAWIGGDITKGDGTGGESAPGPFLGTIEKCPESPRRAMVFDRSTA